LNDLIAQSVGLEWGWFPLIVGAGTVVVSGMMAPNDTRSAGRTDGDPNATESAQADDIIAHHISQHRQLPEAAHRLPTTNAKPTFGKRR
jgi:hypothetical protein